MKAFIFALICLTVRAGDCAPLTFSTLSALEGTPVPFNEWYGYMKGDFTLGSCVDTWGWRLPLVRLARVYVRGGDLTHEIQLGTPYLWVGEIPAELQAVNQTPGDNAHCAVAIFRADEVELIHTLNLIYRQRYYVERVAYPALLERTFVLYQPNG